VTRSQDGGAEIVIADDGTGERRRRSFEEIEERARTLRGTVKVDQADGGTEITIAVPSYTAGR
jgi:signal transduction histidine kinase